MDMSEFERGDLVEIPSRNVIGVVAGSRRTGGLVLVEVMWVEAGRRRRESFRPERLYRTKEAGRERTTKAGL